MRRRRVRRGAGAATGNTTARATAAAVAGLLLAAGCSGDPTGGGPTTGTPGGGASGPPQEVGETVASWDERDSDERLEVGFDEVAAVLTSQEEYDAWLHSLPLSEESVDALGTDIDLLDTTIGDRR